MRKYNKAELEVVTDRFIEEMVKEVTKHKFRISKNFEKRWDNLEVKYNPRLRSTLGRCWWRDREDKCVIEINPECPEEEFDDTIKHEVLHLITGLSDTKAFKNICDTLGVDFTHTVDLEKAEDYKYYIYCEECGGLLAKRKRKSKLIKKSEHYHSSCCHADLIVESS